MRCYFDARPAFLARVKLGLNGKDAAAVQYLAPFFPSLQRPLITRGQVVAVLQRSVAKRRLGVTVKWTRVQACCRLCRCECCERRLGYPAVRVLQLLELSVGFAAGDRIGVRLTFGVVDDEDFRGFGLAFPAGALSDECISRFDASVAVPRNVLVGFKTESGRAFASRKILHPVPADYYA